MLVIKGIVNRFATASRTKALRIVEPSWAGSGLTDGFAAGDLELEFEGMIDVENLCGAMGVRGSRLVVMSGEVVFLLGLSGINVDVMHLGNLSSAAANPAPPQ